jgi:hypothetical protein
MAKQLLTGLLTFGGFLFFFCLNKLCVFGYTLFSRLYLSWLPPFLVHFPLIFSTWSASEKAKITGAFLGKSCR